MAAGISGGHFDVINAACLFRIFRYFYVLDTPTADSHLMLSVMKIYVLRFVI